MNFKVYWRNKGDRAWKVSARTKKPVSREEANAIYLRYVTEHGCEAKIKEVK